MKCALINSYEFSNEEQRALTAPGPLVKRFSKDDDECSKAPMKGWQMRRASHDSVASTTVPEDDALSETDTIPEDDALSDITEDPDADALNGNEAHEEPSRFGLAYLTSRFGSNAKGTRSQKNGRQTFGKEKVADTLIGTTSTTCPDDDDSLYYTTSNEDDDPSTPKLFKHRSVTKSSAPMLSHLNSQFRSKSKERVKQEEFHCMIGEEFTMTPREIDAAEILDMLKPEQSALLKQLSNDPDYITLALSRKSSKTQIPQSFLGHSMMMGSGLGLKQHSNDSSNRINRGDQHMTLSERLRGLTL